MAAPAPDPDPRLPSPDDVAALLRARTQDTADDEIGVWSDTTRPTLTEVNNIIVQCGPVVYGRVGPVGEELTCPRADDLRGAAKSLVAWLAAMLIELSYFPEQIDADRSAFEHYRDLWNDQVDSVVDQAALCRGEAPPEEGGEAGFIGQPSWAFPVDAGGMVGWQTKW